jgi:hypothetical protein
MGAWGTGIFQDDIACDIRNEYEDHLGSGLSAQAAKARILESYASSFRDEDECGVAWLSLAAEQWRTGRLDNETRDRALEVIDSGSDLARWSDDAKNLAKRRAALEKLRIQLTSPLPPAKKIARRIPCECPWKPGDSFAYRLISGNSIIFRVVDRHTDRGGTYPVCELLDWTGAEIPEQQELRLIKRKRSRPDYNRTIAHIMLVGLSPKWSKRVNDVRVGKVPFHRRIWKRVAGTSIRHPRETVTVVHFRFLDVFLKENFLLK